MARLEIDMIDHFIFKTQIPIRISDVNYARHVGHDALISILHEARVRFLKEIGYAETKIEGLGLMISDLGIMYKSQVFYGDTLTIEIGTGDFNKYGCDIFYKVSSTQTHSIALYAKTGIVFFNYEENRISKVPQEFITRTTTDRPAIESNG